MNLGFRVRQSLEDVVRGRYVELLIDNDRLIRCRPGVHLNLGASSMSPSLLVMHSLRPEGLGGQIVQVAYLTRTVVLRKRRSAFHTNESLAFVSFVACTGYLSFNCSPEIRKFSEVLYRTHMYRSSGTFRWASYAGRRGIGGRTGGTARAVGLCQCH